jgi:hypothetical protein
MQILMEAQMQDTSRYVIFLCNLLAVWGMQAWYELSLLALVCAAVSTTNCCSCYVYVGKCSCLHWHNPRACSAGVCILINVCFVF